jgi:metal transporter CNNM
MHGLIVCLIVVCLIGLSAICSGLNVAFMSLDLADLRRKSKLGNAQAKRLLPLRRNRHLTLAAILLTNVAAVSATSLVLESGLNGILAGVITTILIVIFGEIVPQAYFARNALHFCATLVPVMRLMTVLTYPLSKPIQKILDRLFGSESPRLHSRQELGVMIAEHLGNSASDLDEDEVEIIRGALQLSEKHTQEIMCDISDVYWLTPDTLLDQAKLNEMKDAGFSRIPVFDHNLQRCYGILLIKDLLDVDFETNAYLVETLPIHPSQTVGSRTALDTLFRKFIKGGVHLIPVVRDDRIAGIVTIEDLLEEIVGHEIEDEIDRRLMRQAAD